MSTINYVDFETPTGSWAGSNIAPPEHLGLYSSIKSSVTDLDKTNPIITFSFDGAPVGVSGKLKVIAMDNVQLPFDEAYVDISSYTDYVLIKNNSGVWNDQNESTFTVAYTSGGFWAMGTTAFTPPGLSFTAYGAYNENIINLTWGPVAARDILEGEYDENGFVDMGEFDWFEANVTALTGLSGFIIDKNSYSWQARRVNINSLDSTGIIVKGLDSNSQMQTLNFSSGEWDTNSCIEFYWSGNALYKNNSPDINRGLYPPAPFNNTAFISGEQYGSVNVYANEPMIQYTKINDHTIRIDTTAADVAALIPPLRKLYVNFSGITV
jgi:hypothetical protein